MFERTPVLSLAEAQLIIERSAPVRSGLGMGPTSNRRGSAAWIRSYARRAAHRRRQLPRV